jgi:hypothetical protein
MLLIRQLLTVAALLILILPPPALPQGDPEGVPDFAYITCGNNSYNPTTGLNEVVLQLRYFTDNSGVNRASSFAAQLLITGSNIVSVDTTIARAFTGSSAEHFAILSVYKDTVLSGTSDPSVPPFHMLYAAVDFQDGLTGDSVFARIVVNVNDTGVICVDTFCFGFLWPPWCLNSTTLSAITYRPLWSVPYCCPVGYVIPTLTEWGLIIFGLLLLGSFTLYLRKHARPRQIHVG